MNKIIIIGNLGRDPEMRITPNGQNVTNFSIASNRKWKDAGGELHEETEWFQASAWGRQAEVCNEYLSKGSHVYIEGRLTSRTWETDGGEPRFSMDVSVTEMQMLGGGNGGGERQEGASTASRSNGRNSNNGRGEGRRAAGTRSNGRGSRATGGEDEYDDLPF